MENIYYLERSPLDGSLITAIESSENGYYIVGQLYILKNKYKRLKDEYKVKVFHEDNVYYDKIIKVKKHTYKIVFSRLNIGEKQPLFTAYYAGDFRNFKAWFLKEENPDFLDRIEEEFGYNIIGETE
ncbi:hypothetical protein AA14337_1549 [Acetobacter malorum DSM 14337]|uniref:Uncharacterized protein n=1 Tax=Acetobacter malorum DSM 14337 TaxID=1307910 RepID=A0ABQ0PSL8_9PROT|nr:hypothetical protein [Acetobacter malorum]GBQ79824.1 hypothetical protein AA14337_1549 [Acetobacter malorum DSM 14337]